MTSLRQLGYSLFCQAVGIALVAAVAGWAAAIVLTIFAAVILVVTAATLEVVSHHSPVPREAE